MFYDSPGSSIGRRFPMHQLVTSVVVNVSYPPALQAANCNPHSDSHSVAAAAADDEDEEEEEGDT